MTRVPTEAEIDAMSEEELEEYLSRASQHDSAMSELIGPSGQEPEAGWLQRSGAPRSYGLLLLICSAIGGLACWQLIRSQIQLLKEPLADLTCDLNPLVACGDTLNVWQGNLLGVPNSFVGAMAFAALAAIGALLLSGVRLPRWIWWALSAGCAGGIAFVAWFLTISVVTFAKLCPYCMVIWAVTIPVAVNTWAWAALGGHLGLSREVAGTLAGQRWWITGLLYLMVVLVIVVAFWNQWMALL
ncbi:vitamin K epoxide reductase family protein [Actinomyces slackii]|uniref:Predicted membrane protein n=1 Tax=Actinomyces slackii TaxID=52774 RepID=A0A3S4SPT2_9ACTO|nr:vitamin K epoxide reductase family protein [Actinomyces slackii]VEG74967.1 Predicted membrane protein [Actinomyces slackii]